MEIPILNGVYTDAASDFRTSYPRNMVPVPKVTGISQGYLRPADGIVQFGTSTAGIGRGGINWNDACYRVMGTSLVRIASDGSSTVLGDVGGSGHVTFDYSFDRLAVSSGGNLFYWDGSTLTQVTDADLGTVVDFLWVDGYFMSTDGAYLIVTELNDPLSVNPLKYGSAEADPDAIKGLIKIRNEVYALNRYTVEVFQNIGGDYFPFQRVEGAQMMRGVIGTYAAAMLVESLVFLGGGRNEAPAVWIGSNGQTVKISTREVDQVLSDFTESDLSQTLMETRIVDGHQFLYMHLPNQTWVYDAASSQHVGQPVWFKLTSSLVGDAQYKARNFVWCYNKWLCEDPTAARHGYLTSDISSHYGEINGWEFGTQVLYNEGRSAIVHELELVALTGRVAAADNPTIWTSYSIDGETWSQESPRSAGQMGQTLKRLTWMQQGFMRNWRVQKFRGDSRSHLSVARIEARIEAMNV